MYELALKILAAVAGGDGGTIRRDRAECRCHQPPVDSATVLLPGQSREDPDLTHSAIGQLVSLGFLEWDVDHYKVSMAGEIFANTYDLLNREGEPGPPGP